MNKPTSHAQRRRLCNTLKVLNLLAAGKSPAFAAFAVDASSRNESFVEGITAEYGPEPADYRRNARKLLTTLLEQEAHKLMPETSRPKGHAA